MLYKVMLQSHDDFDGWRNAARALIQHNIDPANVQWQVAGTPDREGDLFAADRHPLPPPNDTSFPIAKGFMNTARLAICNTADNRFHLLTTILRRLTGNEPHLLRQHGDPDVQEFHMMAKNVSRARHKMKAFVRFREYELPDRGPLYIAWFEPAHYVVRLTAPFFTVRFKSMNWSILTPDLCAHWNGEQLQFSPGIPKPASFTDDKIEQAWLTYYSSIFNPARVKKQMMQSEMPKHYWKNLPEAALIPDLLARADERVIAMIRKNE